MIDPLTLLTAVAQKPRWQDMGSGFRGREARFETSDLVYGIMILVGVIVAVILLKLVLARQEGRRGMSSPRGLFRALCKAHGLDRRRRKLLRRLARWQRLDHPARLFLEPDRFDAGRLSAALQEQSAEFSALRDRLFSARSEDDLPSQTRGKRDPLALIKPLARALEPATRRTTLQRAAESGGAAILPPEAGGAGILPPLDVPVPDVSAEHSR